MASVSAFVLTGVVGLAVLKGAPPASPATADRAADFGGTPGAGAVAGQRAEAAIERLTPGGTHFFFGYYDVPAMEAAGGRHLVHRVPFRDRLPTANDEAVLGTIDIEGGGTFRSFAKTSAWNFQQGAMLQWLGDGSGRVFYNEVAPEARGYRGVLHDIATNACTFTDRALANVSRDGRWGLAIDFDRMHDFRPGYGYALRDDPRAGVPHPPDDGIWLCELRTGRSRLVLSLGALHERVRALSPLMERKLLVNHITFNPSATRFVFLLRNFPAAGPPVKGQSAWQTAVFTAARDGGEVRILVPPGYASHYHWRDDATIVFHSDGPQGRQLYEITDAPTPRFTAVDPAFFKRDGHCSYSADGRWMLYDSYPDAARKQHLYVYDLKRRRGRELGAFASPPAAVTDVRCDLHPRWLPGGRVSFDSTHEDYRGVYALNLRPLLAAWEREP
ncbi:MAG: hypothetical protein Q7S40_21285 [Opitutaceae bacterium]|nr:hypothetical protein [Opitutaceae bacterium]